MLRRNTLSSRREGGPFGRRKGPAARAPARDPSGPGWRRTAAPRRTAPDSAGRKGPPRASDGPFSTDLRERGAVDAFGHAVPEAEELEDRREGVDRAGRPIHRR